MEKHGIILFDGVCNLCNGFVQKIIKADSQDFFRFASLQSETAKTLLANHPIEYLSLKTIVYIEDGRIYSKSDAALRIAAHLKGAWRLTHLASIFPKTFRDRIYDIIAKNRYQWFGRQQQCMVPTAELRSKFL
ncbi:thiol-disulfide oxidoreductase [Pelobium manganitolerans]|uniref:Thiol-disulfide oxidoreductase n=1 Tax=Pelobium manganitolerans TaxID=1842495 RepID=A0A419SBN6_9SPHI|nr:thiol-disulfide oxidoreductase DCC family protein [Pelobium manganitolerans]RKD20080.1 thiol-disulfide oxidoreductase [Pelobium manganitolerans]